MKRILILALVVRLVYALVLHLNGAYHGDELNIDLGAQLFAGLDEFQTQHQVDLFEQGTEAEFLQSQKEVLERRNLLWLIDAVQGQSLIELGSAIITDPLTVNFPGFYILIGSVYWLFGYLPLIYRLLSALIGGLSVYLLYRVGKELNLSEKAVLMACGLYAILPLGFQFSGTLYKEPIAQFFFFSALFFYLRKNFVVVGGLIAALFLMRPTSTLLFLGFVGLAGIARRPALLRASVITLIIALVIPIEDVTIIGRSAAGLAENLENTALLSKLPLYTHTFGGAMLANAMLGLIGLLQPIPFLYGKDAGGINHLVVLWTVTGIEWAIVGPIVLSSIILAIRHRNSLPNYHYFLVAAAVFVWICGFGAAANESVRYRDLMYPFMLLLVGWNYDYFGYVRRSPGVVFTFYPLFFSGIIYGVYRWFL